MLITIEDGTEYQISQQDADELDDTFCIMAIHEIFEKMTPKIKHKHRYKVWLAATG